MELWRKNFLLSFTIFTLILDISLFLLGVSAFQHDFDETKQNALHESTYIGDTVETFVMFDVSQSTIAAFGERYALSETYLQMKSGDQLVMNTLPKEVPTSTKMPFSLYKSKETAYFTSFQSFKDYYGETFTLVYARDASAIYQNQHRRVMGLALASVLLPALACLLLYITMKQIYRPVENIAHELRTPLTNIQGYSEYLMRVKTDEAERFEALEKIFHEADRLKEVTEKLLIMGKLKEGTMSLQTISVAVFMKDLAQEYPALMFTYTEQYIQANEILLKSLFTNLLNNAYAAGQTVSLDWHEGRIRMTNDGEQLSLWQLFCLNHRLPLRSKGKKRFGRGVRICWDIIKLHHGKLRYIHEYSGATTVIVTLPKM